MTLHPLIFIPKVRDIEAVKDSWDLLFYDKLIVENMPEMEAYHFAKHYFLMNKKYTHLVICPDDLVIDYNSFESLKRKVLEYDYSNLSGIANKAQNEHNVYCCQNINEVDYQFANGGTFSYYNESNIPDETFQAGFTGFCCQWINREIMEQVTFNGSNDNNNCLDWQFARELNELEIPLLVDPESQFKHLSREQRAELRQWKLGNDIRKQNVYMVKDGMV
jgi:hypothetical protein